ncbi:cytochrome P450 [Yinghuangia sp. ASG 101]|uniref:cytochrome P450 n=1 Tax=Yinghuangia sp. ASG 101 TaxID=2896848 RepID=UPI001E35D4B3|nr:cytochrome P450 [Yinghuangia sp. ASG 101]UGQ12794.1 cytochrome P450 [Yinghuangia sp. ASG 101]
MSPTHEPGPDTPAGCPVAHSGPDGGLAIFDAVFADNPAAAYRELRAQHGPVAPVQLAPGIDAMLVLGYDEALKVLRGPEDYSKDPRRWRALAEGRVPRDSPILPMMIRRPVCQHTDGEEHARLRRAVEDSFDRVDPITLRAFVEGAADALVDRFCAVGEADLVADYAKILPLLTMNHLFGCSEELGERIMGDVAAMFELVDAEKASADMAMCFVELLALKRERPGLDVTSWLLAHEAGLTDEELADQLMVLIGAGVEPEQNLILNALRLLLFDKRFADDLAAGTLQIDAALDEALWYEPPLANFSIYFPVRDVELGGVALREGDPVVISYAAANTDPSLKMQRTSGSRAHLSWSAGPHTCPTKDTARLIATVAIEKLIDRLPDMEPAVGEDELRWRPGPFHRALAALPVRFPAAEPVARVPVAEGTGIASAPRKAAVDSPAAVGAEPAGAEPDGVRPVDPEAGGPKPVESEPAGSEPTDPQPVVAESADPRATEPESGNPAPGNPEAADPEAADRASSDPEPGTPADAAAETPTKTPTEAPAAASETASEAEAESDAPQAPGANARRGLWRSLASWWNNRKA